MKCCFYLLFHITYIHIYTYDYMLLSFIYQFNSFSDFLLPCLYRFCFANKLIILPETHGLYNDYK